MFIEMAWIIPVAFCGVVTALMFSLFNQEDD